jgi:hypothetical protein
MASCDQALRKERNSRRAWRQGAWSELRVYGSEILWPDARSDQSWTRAKGRRDQGPRRLWVKSKELGASGSRWEPMVKQAAKGGRCGGEVTVVGLGSLSFSRSLALISQRCRSSSLSSLASPRGAQAQASRAKPVQRQSFSARSRAVYPSSTELRRSGSGWGKRLFACTCSAQSASWRFEVVLFGAFEGGARREASRRRSVAKDEKKARCEMDRPAWTSLMEFHMNTVLHGQYYTGQCGPWTALDASHAGAGLFLAHCARTCIRYARDRRMFCPPRPSLVRVNSGSKLQSMLAQEHVHSDAHRPVVCTSFLSTRFESSAARNHAAAKSYRCLKTSPERD